MKISLNWLHDYVDFNGPAEQITEILSNVGLPCESIERSGNDWIIDLEITSNRGDCLGHIGVARELAAATGAELKLPPIKLQEGKKHASDLVSVEIAEPKLCGRYTARVIEEVKVGPSPQWMVQRLEAVGLRSVNNVVDATNYAMMETGQPPHAFDYNKITGGKIIVRKALPGERITSIDGTICDLSPEMLVIADSEKTVAIAGVMGGLDTEVTDSTTTILLEDAYFDPVSVRTTSRKLALPSEAAFRFERIVDKDRVDWASQRTIELIIKVAGGTAARGVVDAYPARWEPAKVFIRPSRLKLVLGVEIPKATMMSILSALCFKPVDDGESIQCTVPSWRSDVYREADLIEEVARVYGYDKVPTEGRISIEVAPLDRRQRLASQVGTFLQGCGFYETISVTFVDDSSARIITSRGRTDHLAVKDVSRKNANLLRRSLIGSLLTVLRTNTNAGNLPCRIYELANTFTPVEDDHLPEEKTKLAILCDSDFQDLRGVIEGLLRRLNRQAVVEFSQAYAPWARLAAEIKIDGEIIGLTGIVSEKVTDKFDLKNIRPSAAELDFEQLLSIESGPIKFKPIPRFPAIERDLSIVVDENLPWAQIAAAVHRKAPRVLEDVRFVDIYRGKGIAKGHKSITLSLCFRDEDGTLRHEAVDQMEQEILTELKNSLGAELRTL
ncbi:MAG: phenylalanine--tRNA ligase subunit beta [Planctomycetota bacterium]